MVMIDVTTPSQEPTMTKSEGKPAIAAVKDPPGIINRLIATKMTPMFGDDHTVLADHDPIA
jgi:hypothetical protein